MNRIGQHDILSILNLKCFCFQSCSGSICSKFDREECQCEKEELRCDVCCSFSEKCTPTRDIPKMVELKQSPGAPCDNFNGYCDVFLKCRKVDADGPLARLKNMFFSKQAIMGYLQWIETYWWAVVLMGVGLILLMAGKYQLGNTFDSFYPKV